MPITIKTSGINVKQPPGYDNLSAFFLGDVADVMDSWLSTLNPIGYVTPEMYGAVGNGVTDDTQAWKNCIDSNQIIVATKTYLCSEPLELNNNTYCFGTIINNTTDGVKIIGKSQKTYYINVSATSVIDGATRIGVDIKNCYNCTFKVFSQNFYTGLKIHGDGTGCAYNSIETLYTRNAMYSCHITSENSGWANENYFYNHRAFCSPNISYHNLCVGTLINANGGRNPNSNHFCNCCYEESYCGVHISNGHYNTFDNVRMEGCTYNAIFSSGTSNNIVYPSFNDGSTTDNGTNAVIPLSKIISVFNS